MDGGAWWAAVHGVAKSRTRLSDFTFTFSLSCIGEGNGNPLQCSCLENPRDGGAWWAAIYGVAQSRTVRTKSHWSDLVVVVAVPFSRGSPQPRDQTQVSRIAGKFITIWATRVAPIMWFKPHSNNSINHSGDWQEVQGTRAHAHPCLCVCHAGWWAVWMCGRTGISCEAGFI